MDTPRRLIISAKMFQVASYPPTYNTHAHAHAHMQTPAVQLPRSLTRPLFTEVSRDAIIAVAPELSNVPPEYIRRGLRPKAPQMLAAIHSVASSHVPQTLPRSQLPQRFTIPHRPSPSSSHPTHPTHVLAVASSKSSANEHVFLFPVHSVVIAAHCSGLPRFSPTSPPSGGHVHVPVLPLALPSPAAFKILHSYLYTRSLESVLKALFPIPSGFVTGLSHHTVQSTLASGNSLHQLSAYLCSSAGSSLQALTTHAAHVKELWQDMVAIGLHDPELWDTIDLAWEIVLGALNLAASGQ